MVRIFKYPVALTDTFAIDMPESARVLDVQAQHDEPFIWAAVNPDAPMEARHFRLAGTGHPIPDDAVIGYVGTFQLGGGSLVFHLFEVTA